MSVFDHAADTEMTLADDGFDRRAGSGKRGMRAERYIVRYADHPVIGLRFSLCGRAFDETDIPEVTFAPRGNLARKQIFPRHHGYGNPVPVCAHAATVGGDEVHTRYAPQ